MAIFMGAWNCCVLLQENYAHKIPPFREGFWTFLKGEGGGANSFAVAFSERFFKNWGSPPAPEM